MFHSKQTEFEEKSKVLQENICQLEKDFEATVINYEQLQQISDLKDQKLESSE